MEQPSPARIDERYEVAIAILYQRGQFLLQLRDDIPGIAAPGQWGFFGGHLEPGETPEIAVVREVAEEITYDLTGLPLTKVGLAMCDRVIRHVFAAPLPAPLAALHLKEGWDFAFVTPEIIQAGAHYSAIAQQIRPLSARHRKILLDFMETSLLDWRTQP